MAEKKPKRLPAVIRMNCDISRDGCAFTKDHFDGKAKAKEVAPVVEYTSQLCEGLNQLIGEGTVRPILSQNLGLIGFGIKVRNEAVYHYRLMEVCPFCKAAIRLAVMKPRKADNEE
jgi:hypothetical protein